MADLPLPVQPIGAAAQVGFPGLLGRELPAALSRNPVEVVPARREARALDIEARLSAVGDRLEVVVVVLGGAESDRADVGDSPEKLKTPSQDLRSDGHLKRVFRLKTSAHSNHGS